MTSYESEVFFTTSRKFEQNTFELKIITRKKQPTTSITKCTLKRKKKRSNKSGIRALKRAAASQLRNKQTEKKFNLPT